MMSGRLFTTDTNCNWNINTVVIATFAVILIGNIVTPKINQNKKYASVRGPVRLVKFFQSLPLNVDSGMRERTQKMMIGYDCGSSGGAKECRCGWANRQTQCCES